MSMASSAKVTMKLLIDTTRNKVLFAEASKEVVDFLFNLLQLPLGSVVRLLTHKAMVGCLGNLYKSVENLSDTYMQPNLSKDVLLKPSFPSSSIAISALLPSSSGDDVNVQSKTPTLYMCVNRCHYNVTEVYNTTCSLFGTLMASKVKYVGKTTQVAEGSSNNPVPSTGFVKEVVTYMVMDDLVIQPMSTISSITLLNKFGVKEVGALQEKVVELGMAEGVMLLKASLQTEMVLTRVFLKQMGS